MLRISLLVFILVGTDESFQLKLSRAAIAITRDPVEYDPTYFRIPYPNGDVPANKGVCTDVVIRAYRRLGIDLQKEVHLDMKDNFKLYPQRWGLKHTDTNIDHRRVPNLMTFFKRHGVELKKSKDPKEYEAGDIVTWDLGSGLGHIGIVTTQRSEDRLRPLVAHNIGRGQELSDCLFDYTITGHYRYRPGDVVQIFLFFL